MYTHDVVVVGAGPAGLACAAELQRAGLSVRVVEKAGIVGSSWCNHYERLHLHTSKGGSNLPGHKMPSSYPRYPSRQQVVDYLEEYTKTSNISPVFETEVKSIARQGEKWAIKTDKGDLACRAVVVATGAATNPKEAIWPGLETFTGDIIHSDNYLNSTPYKGKKVLVVGFGNSGGEIALDLAEAKAHCGMSIRRPVRALPRDLFGLPIQLFAIVESLLPYKWADAVNAPILRFVIGSYEKLGLKKSDKGAMAMIKEDGKIPLLDIGTLKAIRRNDITVYAGIERVESNKVVFEDGKSEAFDAIIMATGYRPDLGTMIPGAGLALQKDGFPASSGSETPVPGLYFCGYRVVPTGVLREIGREAKRLTILIKNQIKQDRTA